MRKLTIVLAFIAAFTPLSIVAQQTAKGTSRIFAPQQPKFETAKATAQGGSFQVPCKASFAIDCYKQYFKAFKTKKLNNTDFVTTALGGTNNATITGNATETTVDLTVSNAAFPDLTTKLRSFIQVELLRDTFSAQKRVLEGMVNRKAKTEAENVWLERRIERLKADIANAENKIQLNVGAIMKYEDMIETQKGLVSDIQAQIDELINALPTK